MLKQFQIAKMEYFVDMDICLHPNVEDLIDVDISLHSEDYLDRSKAELLLWIIYCCTFDIFLYYAVLSLPCSIVITCCEKTNAVALFCDVFSCALNGIFCNTTYSLSLY